MTAWERQALCCDIIHIMIFIKRSVAFYGFMVKVGTPSPEYIFNKWIYYGSENHDRTYVLTEFLVIAPIGKS